MSSAAGISGSVLTPARALASSKSRSKTWRSIPSTTFPNIVMKRR